MGIVLDSSVLIAGERRRESVRDILERVKEGFAETEAALSAVTVVELTHGVYRAKTESIRDDGKPSLENCFTRWLCIRSLLKSRSLPGELKGSRQLRALASPSPIS